MPVPHTDSTYGKAIGEQRVQSVAACWAVRLQDAVIQEVARLLRREGRAFALHYAELTHHAGNWKEKNAQPLLCHLIATFGSWYFHSDFALSIGY